MAEKMILSTKHGDVSLPAFFPDGTHGVVRCVDAGDLRRAEVRGLVMNTYHLISRPGAATVKAVGGLHRFAGWDRPILTDSGGFQVFSLIRENAKYGEIRDNEIIFRPEAGGKLILSPEKCIQSQFAFGSDIMMCLDYCTHPGDPEEINRRSVEITIRWGKRCREAYEKLCRQQKLEGSARPKLFGIIQGGGSKELRRECADGLKEIGFDGYGFGGWPMDSQGRLVGDILSFTADCMPDDTPKYAMGVGKPEEIVACARMGYNLFDCVIPTREARHNRLYVFTPEGNAPDGKIHLDTSGTFYRCLYILDDKYIRDPRPLSENCDCECCRNYSRAYLRHLFKVGESLAYRLATIHNLRFYTRLMELLHDDV